MAQRTTVPSGLLNFNHVYYFYIAATEGSIKGAAERLGVTQPTVSEQLRVLEHALGVALFERSGGGLKLTAAGRTASQHAAGMFLCAERLLKALAVPTEAAHVGLRIGVSASISRTIPADFLMPVLGLSQRHPSVHTGELNTMMRALRGGNLDLVIAEAEPADLTRSSLRAELICRPALVAIALIGTEPAEDWSDLSLLSYQRGSVYRLEVEKFLQANGLRPLLVGEVDDALLMLEAVLRGSNVVAFVPSSIVGSALDQHGVARLATLTPQTAGVYAVYPDGASQRVARAIVERLTEAASSE